MSAGPFQITSYQLDDGGIMPIRVQPETVAAIIGGQANDPPVGVATTAFGSASVSQGKRTNGVNARLVRLRFTPGNEPTGYAPGSVCTIPVLTTATFAAAGTGVAATYLGNAAVVVGKTGETVR